MTKDEMARFMERLAKRAAEDPKFAAKVRRVVYDVLDRKEHEKLKRRIARRKRTSSQWAEAAVARRNCACYNVSAPIAGH